MTNRTTRTVSATQLTSVIGSSSSGSSTRYSSPSVSIGRWGRALRTTTNAAYVKPEQRNTQRNWYQKKKGKPAKYGSFFE